MSNTAKRSLFVLALAALAGCGGDLALPTSTGDGVALSVVDGDKQTGTVGEALPKPLAVLVEAGGAPLPGRRVAFTIVDAPAGASLEPDTAVSDEDGRAASRMLLGPETGAYEIAATLVVSEAEPPSAVFEGAAVAGRPDTIRAASPLLQPGRRSTEVPDPPTVVVVDRFGNPAVGARVTWDVTAGGGEVSGDGIADADGRSTVTWILGNGVGMQKLVARVEGAHGSPITFSAAVLF